MKVLSVTSEMYPLVKTGGLADVCGALPGALARQGVDMRVLLPGYPAVLEAVEDCTAAAPLDLPLGAASLRRCDVGGKTVWVLDAPEFYDRSGGPYQTSDGHDYGDNWRRFALLAQAAARIAAEGAGGWAPDIVHGHDWQAGLVPAYLRAEGIDVPSVHTIHNIAFSGRFPAEVFVDLALPDRYFDINGVEFHGDVSFLKAGLYFADAITTVSPTYAEELTRPDFAHGFDGLLGARAADFTGILNGIDTDEWNPATDPLIERRYTPRSPGRRAVNRRALYTAFALAGGHPLVSVISRLTHQKGIELVFEAADDIVARGFNLIVLGTGDRALETAAHDMAMRHAGRIGVHVGYDEALAHRIQAGTDALLVPSRFEPCGLTQLCALRYGALPIVAPTGGLVDSVIDATPVSLDAGVATGLHLREVSASGIGAALGRLNGIMAEPKHHARMIHNAMCADVSWSASAERYAALYAGLAEGRGRSRDNRAVSAAKTG